MATKTKKIIRNLHAVPVNLRFGSSKDPYHITLQRRGQSGDWVEVPADITDHPAFGRNIGLSFEIISSAEAKKIQYGERAAKTAMETDLAFKLERMSDQSKTVGLVNAEKRSTWNDIRTGDTNPMRSNAVGTVENPVPADRTGEPAAPAVSPDLPVFGGVEKR